jgi:hypothetical protein
MRTDRRETDGRTHMSKVIGNFREYANEPGKMKFFRYTAWRHVGEWGYSYTISKPARAFPTWLTLLPWNGGRRLHQNPRYLSTKLRVITSEKTLILILICYFVPRTVFWRIWGAKVHLNQLLYVLTFVNYVYATNSAGYLESVRTGHAHGHLILVILKHLVTYALYRLLQKTQLTQYTGESGLRGPDFKTRSKCDCVISSISLCWFYWSYDSVYTVGHPA